MNKLLSFLSVFDKCIEFYVRIIIATVVLFIIGVVRLNPPRYMVFLLGFIFIWWALAPAVSMFWDYTEEQHTPMPCECRRKITKKEIAKVRREVKKYAKE